MTAVSRPASTDSAMTDGESWERCRACGFYFAHPGLSYPLSLCWAFGRFFGLPTWPVHLPILLPPAIFQAGREPWISDSIALFLMRHLT
ncbi:hypothetical protein QUF75_19075 [Desulfococcaceae bacterium HSG7]|nr:hypothetical protein [Desulfococcaceae bacterium HSG7]